MSKQLTNKEAWRKGYIDGFKGLNPRPDYPLVGLAGSYRLGYEAGYRRRKEPKGPRKNPKRSSDLSWEEADRLGILKRAGVTKPIPQTKAKAFRVTWLSSLKKKRVGFIRPIVADTKGDAITIARSMIDNDKHAKFFVATEIKPNGIVEAAAGLQALDYFGTKAKRASLGKKPKYNPTGTERFLIQVLKSSGGREQFTTNSEKQAKETAASWYSRGASVTIVDRKKMTQTVYGKKNPRRNEKYFIVHQRIKLSDDNWATDLKPVLAVDANEAKEFAKEDFLLHGAGDKPNTTASGLEYRIGKAERVTKEVWERAKRRRNPRAKGSRDALGVFHAENPQGFRHKDYEQLVKEYGEKKAQRAFHYWIAQPFNFRASVKALPFLRANEYLWNTPTYDKRVDNPGKMFYVYAQVKPNVSGNHDPFLVASGIFGSKTSALAEAKRTYKESYNPKYLNDLEWKVLEYRIRKNPSVTDLSRTFQGEADGSIDRLYAADGAPANLARAGKLVFLKVKGKTFRIPGAMVAIAPNEKLWITGNPPLFETKARKGEGLDVGEVTYICYETAKAHIGNGKTYEYVHEFGEDGGKRPHLIIDHEGMPILRGGDYKIRAEGIIN